MWRSSVICLATLLGVSACGNEIVLGDSTLALPETAGVQSGNGGANSASAGMTTTAGTAATTGGMANVAGTAGTPDPGILPPGDVVWSTDHEVGDFSDWERGGAFYGGEYEWGDVNAYVDIGIGRDGSNGVVADINTDQRNEPSAGVRLYRRIEDGPAYYSAWFRLEDAHSVVDWWSIFLFHARDDSLSLDNDVSLWDVRVIDTPDGDMALQFFDHDLMQGTLAIGKGTIQARKWFEIRAYLDFRPPSETHILVWLDDTLLFDMPALHTDMQANVFWCVGNGAGKLDPADSTLDLDDAAIRKASTP
jgi:hypothetical protein